MTDVSDYYQKGFLPFENGQMQVLDDFSKIAVKLEHI